MNKFFSLCVSVCVILFMFGCTAQEEPPAEAQEPRGNSPPDPAIAAPETPEPPPRAPISGSKYFTNIMPPLTAEEERMVNELVPEDIQFDFENYKCFSHDKYEYKKSSLKNRLTWGELWRYTGEDGVLKLDSSTSVQIATYLPMGYPSILPHLKSIKKLRTDTTRFKRFREDIEQMTLLTEFVITEFTDRLDEDPENLESLLKLTNLESLALQGSELPDIFDNFKKLKHLSLSSPSLSLNGWPPSVFRIETLVELNLGSNNLEYIPKEIARLKNLERLDLSWNPIRHIPDEICGLTKLRELNLVAGMHGYKGFMKATDDLSTLADSLPENIGNLSNLRRLVVEYFPITKLPDSICNLKGLEKMSLHLPLKSIPDDFSNLNYIPSNFVVLLDDDFYRSSIDEPMQQEINRLLARRA